VVDPVGLHKWSIGVPWLGTGCGSRVPMGSCESVTCRILFHYADASASTPYRRSYTSLQTGDGEQGVGEGWSAKVQAERFPSPSLWKSFTRRLREHLNNVAARKSSMSPMVDILPRFSVPENSPYSPHCSQRSIVGLGLRTTS
jgi:hypothetical protein